MSKLAEQLSVFDMFKIGIGPSSSHTLGPWRAARRFLRELPDSREGSIRKIYVDLYGALSKTGHGHGTEVAIQLGLLGEDPETVDVTSIDARLRQISVAGRIPLLGAHSIPFRADHNIRYNSNRLEYHPNAVQFTAVLSDNSVTCSTYYSIGGGFVVAADEKPSAHQTSSFGSAEELLAQCFSTNSSIAEVSRAKELSWLSPTDMDERLKRIKEAMMQCVYRGCHTEGVLPGGLFVQRRAAKTARRLLHREYDLPLVEWFATIANKQYDFQSILQWVTCFALAVNEENASFGRVVTAPTNGSAGVIPAVMLYAMLFCDAAEDCYGRFLLTAGEIGCLFKNGATISAAEGGCQAEIGVSSAMAAAALTEILCGSPRQSLVAAEIAMEHHLGMARDPIGGLVQIPCIERNAFGAIKAITASQLALARESKHARVSLDAVIRTMWATAQDMNERYKETGEGSLAAQIPVNVNEC